VDGIAADKGAARETDECSIKPMFGRRPTEKEAAILTQHGLDQFKEKIELLIKEVKTPISGLLVMTPLFDASLSGFVLFRVMWLIGRAMFGTTMPWLNAFDLESCDHFWAREYYYFNWNPATAIRLRQSLFHLCSSALFVSIALPLRLW
jgi:hypothetical protein